MLVLYLGAEIAYSNPLKNIRLFEQPEKEMVWLTEAQIKKPFAACKAKGNPQLTLNIIVYLSTECRRNEFTKLKSSKVTPHKIILINIKDKRNRTDQQSTA